MLKYKKVIFLKKTARLAAVCAVLICVLLVLSGCSIQSEDELLVAPKFPKDYQTLQSKFDQILASGQRYASPEEGENRNTLQLVDLDADGENEAISFFQDAGENGAFSVYVHKKIGDEYIQAGVINGTGTKIAEVRYPKISVDGDRAIVVCWALDGNVNRGMTVLRLNGTFVETILDIDYTTFITSDLDADGQEELIVVVQEALTGRFLARLYSSNEKEMSLLSQEVLSRDIKKINNIQDGRLDKYSGFAVFVESSLENGGYLTDVLIRDGNNIKNITIDAISETSDTTYRPIIVNSTDVDGDGVTEVPTAKIMPGYSKDDITDAQWRIIWSKYNTNGSPSKVFETYHNINEEWFFVIPDEWGDNATVVRKQLTDETITTIGTLSSSGKYTPYVNIFVFTGDDREQRSSQFSGIPLGNSMSAVFAATISSESLSEGLGMSEEEIRDAFNIIPRSWHS